MKSTGIVRKIDSLGRVVLPKEMRRTLKLDEGTPVEVLVDQSMVVLRKYSVSCLFCGETKGVQYFKGQLICDKCLSDIGKKKLVLR